MITIDTMYSLYTVENELKIKAVEKDLAYYKPSIDKSIGDFTFNKDKFYLSDAELISIIEGKALPISNAIASVNKFYNIKLSNYNALLKCYNNKKEQLEDLSTGVVSKSIFVFIITRFNELLVEAIMKKGYKFKHLYLGYLNLRVGENKRPVVNWGETTKRKLEIIKEGGIPFVKADADAIGEEYKGIKYLVHLPTYRLYFEWGFKTFNVTRLPNLKNFTFLPTRGQDSSVRKLSEYNKEFTQEELLTIYNTQKKC